MTNVSGKLPAGDGNGLNTITEELVEQAYGRVPPKMHVCICLVDAAYAKVDGDTHETTVTARIRRIEVIRAADDKGVAEGLMRRALDVRTGREALPYDLEQELRGVFDHPDDDPETGAGSGLELPPLDDGEGE